LNSVNDCRSAESFQKWDYYYLSALFGHSFTSDDSFRCVIPAFDEYIGLNLPDEIGGRILVKANHRVNAPESEQYQCASCFALDGAGYSLDFRNAPVAVKSYDEKIAKRPSVFQILDVTRMDEVKAAICEAEFALSGIWAHVWESVPK
jgi:hypothetical protein